MKIYDSIEPWPDKVNFVDKNNVCLGYDLTEQCCENVNWYITNKNNKKLNKFNINDYIFDISFIKEIFNNNIHEVIFRIINKNKELFIHLQNISEEGWYIHGFELKQNDTLIKKDYV